MTLNGIDVSAWQKSINLTVVPADFVISKITGGMSGRSSDFDRQWRQAKAAGKLRGAYHFAKDGGPVNSSTAEADNFVKHITPYLDGETILALDWEADALPLGASWAKTWLDRVYAKTGVRPLIYMSASVATQAQWKSVVAAGYGLWIAAWGTNKGGGYKTPSAVSSGQWPFAAIRQYTSNGQLNGYSGRLDLDIFYGNRDAWKAYAKLPNVTEPTPDPTPIEEPRDEPQPAPEPSTAPLTPEELRELTGELPQLPEASLAGLLAEHPAGRKAAYYAYATGALVVSFGPDIVIAGVLADSIVPAFVAYVSLVSSILLKIGVAFGFVAAANTQK